MTVEISAELHFAKNWVEGTDNYFPDASIDERLRVLGVLDGCPNPSMVAETFGGNEKTIQRYAECNLVGGWILEKAKELNPSLYELLHQSEKRPSAEIPFNFDPRAVPSEYIHTVPEGSVPVRYAAARVLIEQFGRTPGWQIGSERVRKGFKILEDSLILSVSPQEFLGRLAEGVTNADADEDAVLSHMFAIESEEEGNIFLLKKLVAAVQTYSPKLWRRYSGMSQEQKLEIGVTTEDIDRFSHEDFPNYSVLERAQVIESITSSLLQYPELGKYADTFFDTYIKYCQIVRGNVAQEFEAVFRNTGSRASVLALPLLPSEASEFIIVNPLDRETPAKYHIFFAHTPEIAEKILEEYGTTRDESNSRLYEVGVKFVKPNTNTARSFEWQNN